MGSATNLNWLAGFPLSTVSSMNIHEQMISFMMHEIQNQKPCHLVDFWGTL